MKTDGDLHHSNIADKSGIEGERRRRERKTGGAEREGMLEMSFIGR